MAGSGKGLQGERSGLWSECVRLVSELRPQYALFENVANLLRGDGGRWFATVLNDLAQMGYDAEWGCISAANLGAAHRRERLWIIAYPNALRRDMPEGIFNRKGIAFERPPPGEVRMCLDSQWLLHNGDLRDIRKHDGLSQGVDRLAACGNALMPQIASFLGNQILADMKAL